MNIYDLAIKYISQFPTDATNLLPNTRINLNTLSDNTIISIFYRGYSGLMAKPNKFNPLIKKPYLGYFDFYIDSTWISKHSHKILKNKKLYICLHYVH